MIRLFETIDADKLIRYVLTHPRILKQPKLLARFFPLGFPPPSIGELVESGITSSTLRREVKRLLELGLLEEHVLKPPEKPKIEQLVLIRKGKPKPPRGRPKHVYVFQSWYWKLAATQDIKHLKDAHLPKNMEKFIYKSKFLFIECGLEKELLMSEIRFVAKFFRAENALEYLKRTCQELERLHPELKGKLWPDKITSQDLKDLAYSVEKNLPDVEKNIELALIKQKRQIKKALCDES